MILFSDPECVKRGAVVMVSFNGAHFSKDVIYRAVDKAGQSIDFLLTEEGDERAARRFRTKAIRRRHGVPEKVATDGSEASAAAIPKLATTAWLIVSLGGSH
jgi:transposase-like protein